LTTVTDTAVDDGAINLVASNSVLSSYPPLINLVDAVNQVNIHSDTLNINSTNIGSGSIEPIVVDVDTRIHLTFTSDTAYIINLNNTALTSSGEIVDVISDRIQSSDRALTTGLAAFDEGINYDATLSNTADIFSVLSPDERTTQTDSNDTFRITSLVPDVPSLIRTKEGWIFSRANYQLDDPEEENKDKEKTHTRKRDNKDKGEKRVEWYLEGFKYRTPDVK